MRWPGVAVLLLPATFGSASVAWGFARERVDPPCDTDELGCVPLQWTGRSCVIIDIYMNGFSEMSRDEVGRALGAAAHAWSPSAVECPTDDPQAPPGHPYLELVPSLAPPGATAKADREDAHNVLLFRTSGWREDDDLEDNAVAVTSVTAKKDGRLLDMDIQVNAELFHWANLDPGGDAPAGVVDLQNAITHEFGHFLGLAHVCNAGADDDTIDDKGNLIPSCLGSLPPDIETATMHAIVGFGETRKRTLEADDMRGICTIYPPEKDPKVCALDLPDDGCGCATVDARVSVFGLALALLALAARARRPASRRSA